MEYEYEDIYTDGYRDVYEDDSMSWEDDNVSTPKHLDKEDRLLIGVKHSTERGYDYFKNTFEKHRSPLSYLTSYKIKPLYLFLDGPGRDQIHHYILDQTSLLLAADQLKVSMTLKKDGSQYTLHFNHRDKHLFDWSPLDDKLQIPCFDQALTLLDEIKKERKKLKENEEELFMTQVWVKNPRSLWGNKMRNLYIYSIFRPKRFKKDMQRLLAEIEEEQAKIRAMIDHLQFEVDKRVEDPILRKALTIVSTHYIYFPKIKKISDYQSHLEHHNDHISY